MGVLVLTPIMLLLLLDTEQKMEKITGWLRIPGENTGESMAMSKYKEEIRCVELGGDA